MAISRGSEAAGATRTKGNWLRRTFWLGVMVGAVLGCGLQWAVSTNKQLVVTDAQRAYYVAKPYVHQVSRGQIARWYKEVGSSLRRLRGSHQVAALAPETCSAAKPSAAVQHILGMYAQAPSTGHISHEILGCAAPRLGRITTRGLGKIITPAKLAPPSDTIRLVSSTDTLQSSTNVSAPAAPQLPTPVSLVSLAARADCSAGVTLSIVAHEDDDLLFLNPDIATDISRGHCVRTVYLTAGDSGQSSDYWIGRENGSKAAYAAMYGLPDIWHDEYQQVGGRLVAVSYLEAMPRVALIFMRLPDGNLGGDGFVSTSGESLQKLLTGQIPALHTVDNKIAYSKDQLVTDLESIMQTDNADVVRTQDPNGVPAGDHTDHAAAGTLASLASAQYQEPHSLAVYQGYPDRLIATNLTTEQITGKESIFMAYAQHDGAVCQTVDECALTATYGSFLTRQYKLFEVLSGQQAPSTATSPAITY